jgi:dipeptidyl-peptidase-4
VVCAGSAGVVFTGLAERGRASELMLLRPAGGAGHSGATATATATETLTLDPGPGPRWRTAVGNRDCTRLLATHSAWAQPPGQRVLALDGATPPLALPADEPAALLSRIAPQVRAVDFLAADGRTPLNAFYLAPLRASSNPAGHAVIVVAYGGPGVSTVAWRWRGDVPLLALWQRLGFGVLMFDGRGMAGRDRDFTRAHFRAMGQVDVADLFAVVRQLPVRVPGVDAARIGVSGWSYGGFLALRGVLDADTPLAAAVAGAPVVDQTLYDTAYTERYLGLPEGGQATPYVQANLLRRAPLLAKPLLLLHGTADDNVLFENSLRLMQALQAEGRLFETAIYPGQAHGLGDRRVRLHADRTMTDFLVRHLQP